MGDDKAGIVRRLADEWVKCGVKKGGVTLIHSSARRSLQRLKESGIDEPVTALLESFLTAAGPLGTLMFPLFNFDFTKGIPFDIRKSKSQMGSLTEAARLHPEAVRSGHPIYSFAVIGKEAHRFEVQNFSGYGPDSPFALLHQLCGRIGSLDLPDQNSMTFYHYVEEACAVPYRYHKEFTAPYTGQDGLTVERAFGIYVRDIERGVKTHVDPMGEKLWNAGLYSGYRPNTGLGLRTISAESMFKATKYVIDCGEAEGLLYKVEYD